MILAIDAGGTHLRALLLEKEKEVASFEAKSSEMPLGSWLTSLLEKNPKIRTVCISFAGQVNDGTITAAPNMTVDIPDIKTHFERHFPITLYIENDLKCAAIAEAKAHKSAHLCALYVGTGIGLGVIEAGKLIKGHDNFATEIGHIPFSPAPFACGCGRDNCLELFASGSGLHKWARYYNLKPNQTLDSLKTSQEPHAQKIVTQFENALLHAAGCVITLFNPEILVLGGGIIEANGFLVDFIKTNIHTTALKHSVKNVMIVKSNLKHAPLTGATLLKESYV
ncbi:ROK family protein [Sulfurospirillum sp. 1612]|uniref:ROK family protein n=1 Tax=Sulfurospirillum sp. 1612 TaxID=3094835 RepID=UPI002F953B29